MPKYIMTRRYVLDAKTQFGAIWKYVQNHPAYPDDPDFLDMEIREWTAADDQEEKVRQQQVLESGKDSERYLAEDIDE